MKKLPKNLVAFVFFSILLFGFFHFNTAFAATVQDLPALSKQQTDLVNQKVTLQKSITASGVPATTEQLRQIQSLSNQIIDLDKQINAIAGSANNKADFFSFIDKSAKAVAGLVSGIVEKTISTAIQFLMEFILIPIASFYLAVAGKVLNFSIVYTIYDAFHVIDPLTGVNTLNTVISSVWVLVRDMFNVTFIFVLLYVAITKIIGYTSVNTKKMLTSIIISALLINFSLFISKLVIDGGNMVANAFLNQIELIALPAGSIFQDLDVALGTSDKIQLSQRIMGSLGLQSVLDTGVIPPTDTAMAIKLFIQFLLTLITSFMFTFMAILLIGRFAFLIFLMATSPLGFIGSVIPKFAKASSGWWESLIDQTLVAPVFMFFMLLVIKLGNALPTNTGKDMVSYFNYAFIMFLIFKAVSITKSFSGKVGGFADQIATVGSGLALGAATGGASLALSQTLGRAGAAIASNDKLKGAAAGSGITGIGARLALKASAGTAKSSFDVRNTGVGKKTLGLIKSEGGLDLAGDYGKGNTGGFVASRDAYAKQQTEFAKNNLGREISDEDAVKELKEKTLKSSLEMSDIQKKKLQAQLGLDNETNLQKREGIKEQISGYDKQIKEKQEKTAVDKELLSKAAKTTVGGEKTQEAINAIKEISEKQKKAYQEEYAKTEEKAFLTGEGTIGEILTLGKTTKTTGYGKAAAAKIRKEVVKGKSESEQLAELAKKVAKQEADKEAKEKPAEEEKPKTEEKPEKA